MLIFDLRDKHDGGGGTGEYLASYLFAGRTHLDDMYGRATGVTTETWTLPVVRVPNGRPLTKTDWEGTGLEPDVKVAADQALDFGRKLAAEAVNAKNGANSPAGR